MSRSRAAATWETRAGDPRSTPKDTCDQPRVLPGRGPQRASLHAGVEDIEAEPLAASHRGAASPAGAFAANAIMSRRPGPGQQILYALDRLSPKEQQSWW